MTELKACPFCGASGIHHHQDPFGDYVLVCDGCGLVAYFKDLVDPWHTFDLDAVTKFWNGRKVFPGDVLIGIKCYLEYEPDLPPGSALCSVCHTAIYEGSNFCSHCGAKVVKQ